MKTDHPIGALLGIAAILSLGACASPGPAPYSASYPGANGAGVSADSRQGDSWSSHGVIDSIERVQTDSAGIGGSGVGIGTIAGAVVGGVVGNQVGSGRGNTAATVLGAAGGAYLGHELENRQQQKSEAYRITVRMNDGSYQSLMQGLGTSYRVGDRVRIDNGSLQLR